MLPSLQNLSSPARDWTWAFGSDTTSSNHWTTRELPKCFIFQWCFWFPGEEPRLYLGEPWRRTRRKLNTWPNICLLRGMCSLMGEHWATFTLSLSKFFLTLLYSPAQPLECKPLVVCLTCQERLNNREQQWGLMLLIFHYFCKGDKSTFISTLWNITLNK